METPLDLSEFQKHIDSRYGKVDRARGPARTFLWLAEEFGELATAISTMEKSPADPAAAANLREEFADLIAWTCTLANVMDVDLASAVREKYLGEKRPEGHK
jgi:NTP pyrophosphatase (non-canonical NTP hydrolase)